MSKQPQAPTHWRITAKGAGVAGGKAGDIVPAEELAPQVGAMHGRGLIEPAPDPATTPEPTTADAEADTTADAATTATADAATP